MVEGIGLGLERVAEILRRDDLMPMELLEEAGFSGAGPVARVQFGVGPYELLQEINQHNEQAAVCPYAPDGLPDIDQPEMGWLMVKTNALGGGPGAPGRPGPNAPCCAASPERANWMPGPAPDRRPQAEAFGDYLGAH